MSNRQISKDSHSVTSSQELVDGAEPCSSQGGVQTDLFGQGALPANHFQQQEREKEKTMSDTSGQSSLISLESANLQQSLVNRLQHLSDTGGSTIYKLTLKEKATPQQRQYYQLGASAPRTKEKGSSSWPTPKAKEVTEDYESYINRMKSSKHEKNRGKTEPASVSMAAQLTSWPTPSTRDHKGGYTGGRIRNGKLSTDTLDVAAQLTPWATPTATDPSRGTKPPRPQDTGIPLTQQVSGLSSWTTPTLDDTTQRKKKYAQGGSSLSYQSSQVSGLNPQSSTAETESTAPSQLNPRFSLWLMGYPIEWAYSGERVTPSSRKRQPKS